MTTAMMEATILNAANGEAGLVVRAREGDRAAFRVIVEAHKQDVYHLALGMVRNHHDAEDIVQEVFIKAYRSLDRYRAESKIGTWLYRITVNACVDARRRNKAGIMKSLAAGEGDGDPVLDVAETSPHADPERFAQATEIVRQVDRAMGSLTDLERAVFTLRLHSELQLPEIARTLDRAEGTIKNLLFRAIRKVRKELLKQGVTLEPEKCR